MRRSLKSTQRLVRTLLFKVKGTGTAAIQQGALDATLVDNGTGDYTITFATPALRLLGVSVALLADAGDIAYSLHADTDKTRARVKCWDGTDGTTAKDADFYLQVTLSDSADET